MTSTPPVYCAHKPVSETMLSLYFSSLPFPHGLLLSLQDETTSVQPQDITPQPVHSHGVPQDVTPQPVQPQGEPQDEPQGEPQQATSQQILPTQTEPQQMVQVIPLPDPAYSFEFEAIKASYRRSILISLDVDPPTIPADLSSRGLSDQTFNEIVRQVKATKSTSNTNKALLWTGCICCCGIIGLLLVHCRAIGNKKLSDQLAPILEARNQDLGSKGIMVRFAWVQGNLRAYFN